MNKKYISLLFVSGLGIGCGFADPGVVESLPGTYESEASWDLGGPFVKNQSMSENLADIFISHVVSSLGAPQAVQGELERAVSDVIRPDISNMIEEQLPDTLNANSDIVDLLSQDLAKIHVESDLVLAHEKDELLGLDKIVGTERIRHLVLETPMGDVDVPMEALGADGNEPVIESSYSTTVFQQNMTIEDQAVAIRYGKLVSWAFEAGTGVDPTSLTADMAQGLDCGAFVDTLTNNVGIPEVTVSGQTYTMDLQVLSDGCAQLDSGLSANTLGLFEPNADLLIKGPSSFAYDSDGGQVAQIESADGYGGNIDGVPSILSAMLDLSFSAKRVAE